MPDPKLHACAKKMMSEKGLPEENAYALCNWMKSQGTGYFAAAGADSSIDNAFVRFNEAGSPGIFKAGDRVKMFIPITRIDKAKRMVYGFGVTDQKPKSGKPRITAEAMEKALPEWLKYRNIREMHQLSAVGKAKEVDFREVPEEQGGGHGVYIGAKIVDDDAWKKCVEEVYMGFSIGGVAHEIKGNDIVTMGIDEHSLVDNPDVANCTFDMVRSLQSPEAAGVAGEGAAPMNEEIKNAITRAKESLDGLRSAMGEKVERRLMDASRLIEMLQSLVYMREGVTIDDTLEQGKASELTALLDQTVGFFGGIIEQVVALEIAKIETPEPAADATPPAPTEEAPPAEAAAEPTALASAAVGDVLRKGAKLSKATKATIVAVHREISKLLGMGAMSDEQIAQAVEAETKRAEEEEKKKAEGEKGNEEPVEEATPPTEEEKKKKEEEEKKKVEEAARAGDIQRIADERQTEITRLNGIVTEKDKEIKRLNETLKPPKAVVSAHPSIPKGGDSVPGGPEQVQTLARKWADAVQRKDGIAMMKMVQLGEAGMIANAGGSTPSAENKT